MELWYSLVELLPFDWAQSGGMYFMKNALLAVLELPLLPKKDPVKRILILKMTLMISI